MRSSSDWEAATIPDATVLGVTLITRAARDGVLVPGGKYSRSPSSSEPMARWEDGAIDFEHPRV